MIATPADIASLVARNVVPAIGVLFLGWSAGNLLALYWVDTVLEFAVVVLLVARHITGLGKPGGPERPLNGPRDWIGASFGSLLASLLFCAPLGFPIFMLLVEFDWSLSAALEDSSFVSGLALQAAGSVAGCVKAHRDLLARDDDERVLKHRAAFIIARWVVVMGASVAGVVGLLGPKIGGALMLLVYAGATVYFELMPERALALLNPKEARADAARGSPGPRP